MLWGLLVLLKVKCFSWLLLKSRLALRERFNHWGVIQKEGIGFPICGVDREESHHPFFHCSKMYRLWARVADLWDLAFFGVGDVPSKFDILCHGLPKENRDLMWKIPFVALS